jgi:hypothetical protein
MMPGDGTGALTVSEDLSWLTSGTSCSFSFCSHSWGRPYARETEEKKKMPKCENVATELYMNVFGFVHSHTRNRDL